MQVTITTQGGEQVERLQLEDDLRQLADRRGWTLSVTHRERADAPPAPLSRRAGVAAVTDRGPDDPT